MQIKCCSTFVVDNHKGDIVTYLGKKPKKGFEFGYDLISIHNTDKGNRSISPHNDLVPNKYCVTL